MAATSPLESVLVAFVEEARATLGEALAAIVLFGSAAEGRQRPTSDVNVVVVLSVFDPVVVATLRDPLRAARAAIDLKTMFLQQDEVAAAAEAFPEKFLDIAARRRVLHGADPFTSLAVGRRDVLARLAQTTLNLELRTRERWAVEGARPEQAARVLAETAGPLRATARTLAGNDGDAKVALTQLAERLAPGRYTDALAAMSDAREQRSLAAPRVAAALIALMQLMGAIRADVARQRAATPEPARA